MIICPFHLITGYNCPFCGTQRMLLAVIHGQWAEAFAYNPFVACLFLVAIVFAILSIVSKQVRQHVKELCSDRYLLLGVIVLLIWGVVRNFIGI